MRAVLQRVKQASVIAQNTLVGHIQQGILCFLAIHKQDTEKDIQYLAEKIVHLRIFQDENGKMNRSLLDTGGQLLVVSQFTLYGDCRKGRRPNYSESAAPEIACDLYERFINQCTLQGVYVQTGKFQATMDVQSINDGPVTILLDSTKNF